jgi:hypothetical protein
MTGTIYRLTILENEFRRADANGAVSKHRLEQIFQPRPIRTGVVIDQRDVGSLRNFQPCRITSREPCVLTERNNLYLGKVFPGQAN